MAAEGPSTTVIVNPRAGGGRGGRRARDVLGALSSSGTPLHVVETQGPGDATRIAREAVGRGAKTVIAAGGDGTAFETLNGVFPAGGPPGEHGVRLGIIPTGTGNSFLRDFGVTSADEAMRRVCAGRSTAVDIVRVTHRDGVLHYLNLLCLGFAADAAARTNRRYKPFGAPGYVLAVLESLVRLEYGTFPLHIDDGPLDASPCTFLAFSNSKYTGGAMKMAPKASVSDGTVDLVRAMPIGRSTLLRALPTLFLGTHVHRPDVEVRRARRVTFALEAPVTCMVDGEVLTAHLETLEVVPHAIEVFA